MTPKPATKVEMQCHDTLNYHPLCLETFAELAFLTSSGHGSYQEAIPLERFFPAINNPMGQRIDG